MRIKYMNHYYVNKNVQTTGEHEIHTYDCSYLPDANNRIYLGYFDGCKQAIQAAKKYYNNVDGCYYCCRLCHTR